MNPDCSAAASLRREIEATARAWSLEEDTAERLVLVVYELVSNVIEHAATPCRVTVRRIGSVVRVLVTDRSPDRPVLQPRDLTSARGHGLQVVAGLCRRWGWTAHATGKTTWATIDREPA